MFTKLYKFIFLGIVLLSSHAAFAQSPQNYREVVQVANRVIGRAIPIIVALILITFFWGLIKLIRANSVGDTKTAAEGKNVMVWSLFGLFVVMSLTGIIYFIAGSFFDNIGSSLPNPTPHTFSPSTTNF